MRVIAGQAKGRRLKTREGQDTRPTTDRCREALFAILQFEVPEARFLDLFAGSGGVGIEALSRGASFAVFVEGNQGAAACIRENLETTGFSGRSRLLKKDVFAALNALEAGKESFDIVFLDPPYNHGLEQKTLDHLAGTGLVKEGGLIVAESSSQTELSLPEDSWELLKVRDYKLTRFTFFRNIRSTTAASS